MSDEQSFWEHIKIHPDDYTALLVFSDWLQERDDPRAEGIRAMGTLKWQHYKNTVGDYGVDWDDRSALPRDWYRLTTPAKLKTDIDALSGSWWLNVVLSELYSEVALAFSRLPDARRAELLQQEVLHES